MLPIHLCFRGSLAPEETNKQKKKQTIESQLESATSKLLQLVKNVSEIEPNSREHVYSDTLRIAHILEEHRYMHEKKVSEELESDCCKNCGATDNIIELHACYHMVCKFCLRSSDFKCPECDCALLPSDIRCFLTPEEHDKYVDDALKNTNITQCINCQTWVEVIEDVFDDEIVETRIRCVCGTTFCSRCMKSPFHEGASCYLFNNGRLCQFCQGYYIGGTSETCCEKQDCRNRQSFLCRKQLGCGHTCNGFKNESNCECILACNELQAETCLLCLERMDSAAVVKLQCSHIFHYACIQEKLSFGSVGSSGEYNLNYAKCLVCDDWIKHTEAFWKESNELKILCERIERLIQMEHGADIENKRSNLSIYRCHCCKLPYVGGRKYCNEEFIASQEDASTKICPSCSITKHQLQNCEIHGMDSIIYKCNFCCSAASYFCWGTTHFCKDCHDRQGRGERLNLIPLDKFPQCDSQETCPLRVSHPPNGSSKPFIVVVVCAKHYNYEFYIYVIYF